MKAAESLPRKKPGRHLVVTDSGVGGLSICAEIERNLRESGPGPDVRITYFNAWPEESKGYNDQSGMRARADLFDRALCRMEALKPDQILIACNTLSILYELTAFRQRTSTSVLGIIDAGAELFYEALRADPGSFLVILGTKTTIGSRVHLDRLLQRGINGQQIAGIPCHGLAAAIEKDPGSEAVTDLIAKYSADAAEAFPCVGKLYAGLACTHYAYVKEKMRTELLKQSGRQVHLLDPNQRMILQVAPPVEAAGREPGRRSITVEVISKVELSVFQRHAVARQIEPVSAVTARALLAYVHDPDLF